LAIRQRFHRIGDLSYDRTFDHIIHLITSSYRDGDPQPWRVIGTVE